MKVRRGGAFLRVADPEWEDPLDPSFSRARGGRWNPPDSFAVLYLNRDLATARANVRLQFDGLPYGPEDLDADSAPELASTEVPDDDYADAVTDEGLDALGLPASYPLDDAGRLVGWERCRPIGTAQQELGAPGIAARSAAGRADAGLEELAYFGEVRLELTERLSFDQWW